MVDHGLCLNLEQMFIELNLLEEKNETTLRKTCGKLRSSADFPTAGGKFVYVILSIVNAGKGYTCNSP